MVKKLLVCAMVLGLSVAVVGCGDDKPSMPEVDSAVDAASDAAEEAKAEAADAAEKAKEAAGKAAE